MERKILIILAGSLVAGAALLAAAVWGIASGHAGVVFLVALGGLVLSRGVVYGLRMIRPRRRADGLPGRASASRDQRSPR